MDQTPMLDHVALLRWRVELSGSIPLLKIPKLRGSELPCEWTSITFAEFAADVDRVACWLIIELKAKAIASRSVVSVWFSGFEYVHLVYIIALSRASYIPQMFSRSLTDASIVSELMERAKSQAIVYEHSLETLTTACPFPRLKMVPLGGLEFEENCRLPDVTNFSEDDICFVYQSSGSTSETPKLVPYTRRFIKSVLEKRAIFLQEPPSSQDVSIQLGSFCHPSTMFQYLNSVYMGSCLIQPSKVRFSTAELVNMADYCGLNRLGLFSTFLPMHVKAAREDPKVLRCLQGMKSIWYGGASVPVEYEDWCFRNKIPLINMYACAECSILMVSKRGQPSHFLRPLPGVSCEFRPVGETRQLDNPASVQLLEFVLLADSPEIPQPHLLSADGNFHTGDLFEAQPDGSYVFRGRDDDWIKDETTKRCDTKAIEDKVRQTCGEWIKDCVVVGNQRPSPALFIEALASVSMAEDDMKETIIERMRDFNNRRYTHERITDKRLIMVVSEGVLPRTIKGNIRRKIIEQAFSKELGAAYVSVYGY